MNPTVILIFIMVIPLVGSFVGFIIGFKSERYRNIFNVLMTGIVFALVTLLYKYVSVQTIELTIDNIMGVGLHLKIDLFRYIFVWLTTFIWFLITIYSTQYLISYKNRNRYYLFFMITLWSTIGIFISENLINLFTFFEIMSLASYPLIIHDEDEYSHEAGDTYLIMAVAGGLILLMGLFLVYDYTGTLVLSDMKEEFKELGNIKYLISGLIITGFGVKAGMFPLHIWLPKAHPAAPAPASAILSGILLKTGIFGIFITCEFMLGNDIVVSRMILILGFITMFVGGFLAMMQRNIKRILAYSSMSQMGYILVGIGLMGYLGDHRAIAIYGVLFHIINHVIFKVLLFMGAGLVYMVLHELSINKIGGFGRNKTILKIVFFIGLCAIIGMPGFNGFGSKTLLHHALSEAHEIYGGLLFTVGEIVFTISSAFTCAYLLKIFIAVFVEKSNHNIENVKAEITKRALLPMGILGAIVIFIGVRPDFVLNIIGKTMISFDHMHALEDIHIYTFDNVKTSLFTIALGVVIYIGFIRKFLRKGSGLDWWYKNIGLDWFNIENHLYKPVGHFLIVVSSFLLLILDQSVIRTAALVSGAIDSFGKKEIQVSKSLYTSVDHSYEKMKKLSERKKEDEVNEIVEITRERRKIKDWELFRKFMDSEDKVVTNMREAFKSTRATLNSVTYSILMFAIVLVVFLILMLR
ncbi:complex I subunit 5 family protein [Clostridium sp. DL1XJH146]